MTYDINIMSSMNINMPSIPAIVLGLTAALTISITINIYSHFKFKQFQQSQLSSDQSKINKNNINK